MAKQNLGKSDNCNGGVGCFKIALLLIENGFSIKWKLPE